MRLGMLEQEQKHSFKARIAARFNKDECKEEPENECSVDSTQWLFRAACGSLSQGSFSKQLFKGTASFLAQGGYFFMTTGIFTDGFNQCKTCSKIPKNCIPKNRTLTRFKEELETLFVYTSAGLSEENTVENNKWECPYMDQSINQSFRQPTHQPINQPISHSLTQNFS